MTLTPQQSKLWYATINKMPIIPLVRTNTLICSGVAYRGWKWKLKKNGIFVYRRGFFFHLLCRAIRNLQFAIRKSRSLYKHKSADYYLAGDYLRLATEFSIRAERSSFKALARLLWYSVSFFFVFFPGTWLLKSLPDFAPILVILALVSLIS